jgi:hypothetical protein
LHPAVRALHGCNNTACVRVSRPGETGLLHIVSGSQRHNMEMMARARRGGGRRFCVAAPGLLERRSRAVALRDAVKGGWDGAVGAPRVVGFGRSHVVVRPLRPEAKT